MANQSGKVKFFNSLKGFGFIIDNEKGTEIFVHKSGLKNGTVINENDSVTFDEIQGKKGLNAVNVERVS